MKKPQLILIATAAIVSGSTVFGFAEFARGEVVLATTARASYDSRIFGGLNSADDYIFTLDPRFIYRREAGQIKMEATAGMRFNRYHEFREFNSDDLIASVRLRLPPEGGTLASGSFESSYDEHTDINYDVNRRIREKTFANRLTADIPTGLKTALLLGGAYRRDERNSFSDREIREGSAGFRYQNFLGGSAFDVRYRHLEMESSGANERSIPLDQQSDYYSATFSRPLYHDVRGSITYGYRVLNRSEAEAVNGLERRSAGSLFGLNISGPFLPRTVFPKLESSLSLGYQKSETPGINDSNASRFVGAMHVSWQARERTRLSFDARRALELSVNDLTVETTMFSVGLTQAVGNFTSTNFLVGYEQRDYRTVGRQDDVFLAQAGARYQIARSWSAGASYRLRHSQSNLTLADYARHFVSVDATYTF